MYVYVRVFIISGYESICLNMMLVFHFIWILITCLTCWLHVWYLCVTVTQPLVIYTMAYLGFLMSELFELSGIIRSVPGVFCAGILESKLFQKQAFCQFMYHVLMHQVLVGIVSVTHTRVIYLGFLLSEWFGSFLLCICLVIGITYPLSLDDRTVGGERFASYLPWSAIASSESGMRVISVGFLMSELFEVQCNVFTGVMYLGFWMVEVSGKVSCMCYLVRYLVTWVSGCLRCQVRLVTGAV